MHVAEALSRRAGVEEVTRQAAGADSFESLYEDRWDGAGWVECAAVVRFVDEE